MKGFAMTRYDLELFVVGQSTKGRRAEHNLRSLCDERLPGQYQLRITDVLEDAEAAETWNIIATPALVRRAPLPVRVIDGALREFGWPMGPLRLIDEVGVDVTDFIFGELAHYFPGRFVRSEACGRLLRAELRGRKNGTSRGFYRYDGGTEALNEAETRSLVPTDSTGATLAGMSSPDVSACLMRVLVDEARRCCAEGVVASAEDVDLAMRIGAGFPLAKGGLLAWANGQR